MPWDSVTGKPLYNALVWSDLRTSHLCHELQQRPASAAFPVAGADRYRARTGLSISTYFSALKLQWLLRHAPAVAAAAAKGTLRVGTVDSWLLYNLTGGAQHGGIHATDVSNASRTLLLSLASLDWDSDICAELGVSTTWLPKVLCNAEKDGFGAVARGLPLAGARVTGLIGDQQGALLGQMCLAPGDAKATYGTGAFLLMNTGAVPVPSTRGLLTTVAFKLAPAAQCQYALEGSVAVAGAALTWLQQSLELVASAKEIDALAEGVSDNGGVYFVPAFSGLLSPHWRDDARGVVVGLTRFAKKAHLCRAALEAAAFQTKDVLSVMEAESKLPVSGLRVDGGMSRSALLCQFQADLLGTPVQYAKYVQTNQSGSNFFTLNVSYCRCCYFVSKTSLGYYALNCMYMFCSL